MNPTYVDPELVQEARQIEDSVTLDLPQGSARTLTIDVPARTVLKILGILFGVYVLTQVWGLLTLLAVAVMLAAALSPYLALLERRGLNRPIALTVLAVSVLAILGAIVALVVPGLVVQTRDLFANGDRYARDLQTILAQHGLRVNLVSAWATVPQKLHSMNAALMDALVTLFDSAVALGTIAVVTLYLLSDQERLKTFFVGMFPEKRRAHVLTILAELRRQVGGYVRGQGITSALAMLFSFVVLVLAGVPNPLTLSVYVGLADLVPMFGGILGMVPAVLIALTISPIRAIAVFVGFLVYQNIENHLIVPRVYSKTMRVSSLVALVALLIGARLLGILGMIIALPLVAALPVVLDYFGIHLHVSEEPIATKDATDDIEPA